MRPVLLWDDLRLNEEGVPASSRFTLEVAAEGASFGSPGAVVEVIESLLRDGDLLWRTSNGNRQVPFQVRVSSTTMAGLAEGEAALMAREGCTSTLKWTPPTVGAEVAPTTVFDVLDTTVDFVFSDIMELQYRRTFLVTWTCWPWPRSAAEVVTDALPAPGTTLTVLDPCDTATDWTNGQWSTIGDAVDISAGQCSVWPGMDGIWTAIRGADFTVGSTPYLVAEWQPRRLVPLEKQPAVTRDSVLPWFSVNGTRLAPIADVMTTDGWRRTVWPIGWLYSSITELRWDSLTEAPEGWRVRGLWLSNYVHQYPTPRQQTRIVTPRGSVRTQGTIQVSHPSAALGRVLVHTSPAAVGNNPACMPYLVSSETRVANASNISGYSTPVNTQAARFSIPISAIPKGGAHIIARAHYTTAGSRRLVYAAETWLGSAKVGTVTLSGGITTSWNANTWYLVALGIETLPPVQAGAQARVVLDVQNATASTTAYIDEVWILPVGDGAAYTIVDCGSGSPATGGPSNLLWINAPTLADPQGGIWRGTAEDRSDAVHAGPYAQAWSVGSGGRGHEFTPGGTNVFVVSEGASGVAVSYKHWPRWGHNAAE